MFRIIRDLWDWFLSWTMAWSLPEFTPPSLPPIEIWCIIILRSGRYSVSHVYQTEEKARDEYASYCWEHPDEYVWLIVIRDIHRPRPRGYYYGANHGNQL